MTARAHDLGDVLAALLGEKPDALDDRHVGRLRPVLPLARAVAALMAARLSRVLARPRP